jgi:hypothetical protein
MRRFMESYNVRQMHGRAHLLDVLLRAHAEF